MIITVKNYLKKIQKYAIILIKNVVRKKNNVVNGKKNVVRGKKNVVHQTNIFFGNIQVFVS